MIDLIYTIILDSLFAGIAAVGFAMVFNVPQKTLVYCAVGGALAYTFRTIFLELGITIEISTFFASTLIGVIAFSWSRKYLIPRPIYTVASIIPMVPGTYAFTAVISLINMNTYGVTPELIVQFVENALKAGSILGAISFGLALPSLYFIRYNRPII